MNRVMKSFRLSPEAHEALTALSERTGKTQTRILEDRLLVKEFFPPTVEAFLQLEMRRSGRTRDEIVSEAVLKYLVDQTVKSAQETAKQLAERDGGNGAGPQKPERRKAR